MKKQWKRLLIAALTSSSVFTATWYWYQSSALLIKHNQNEKPLAYVGTVVDDIQRRPSSRLLWQLVNTGEPLYDGEAIRTSDRGEVRIQFAESDRYLDLEPESLIVIKKSAGEISLDLMEGSLFVNAQTSATETGAPDLVLNSAQGKVDLSKASVSLSKGSGGAVDIQVIEGKASVLGRDGHSADLSSKATIRIVTPIPQKPIAMNAESLEPIHFQWDGFPPKTQVSLWVGPTRKKMQEFRKADLGQNKLDATLAFGRHFWKLVGTSPTGQVVAESPVYRSEVLARYAPTVVFPTADAEVPVESNPGSIDFKWQKGDDTRQVTLDIWSDATLKKKISSRSFTTEDSFKLSDLALGTYYWRMSSLYLDSETPLNGKVQKFTLIPKDQPPAPNLAMTPVKVDLNLTPEQMTQYYLDKPVLGLSWKADHTDNISSWRIQFQEENADPETAEKMTSTDSNISIPLKKPGRYIASVEALNKDGAVVGSITSQPVTVTPRPLLTAPSFLPREGDLQASNDGRTQLQWTALPGAQEYWLTIRKDGKELRKTRYRTSSTALRNLLPGEYELEISATDSFGRPSEKSGPRKLRVPDTSGLKAPTLKKIQVN